MLQPPDLVHLEPRVDFDRRAVYELLEMAFLGGDVAGNLEQALAGEGREAAWSPELFAPDLFLADFVHDSLTLAFDGLVFRVQRAYLERVLGSPPESLEEVRFRQGILTELAAGGELLASTRRLYRDLGDLVSLFKAPEHHQKLDLHSHRLDLFRQVKTVIDRMEAEFGDARSGLVRLHEAGERIQATEEYEILAALLDFESNMMTLSADLAVGADGKVKHLAVRGVSENRANRFYRSPGRRWADRARLLALHGVVLDQREVVTRLLRDVFAKIGFALVPLVALVGQLELYLTALTFRDLARARGLEVCLPDFDPAAPLRLEAAFNPHLLHLPAPPVPATVELGDSRRTVLVTGPNSGGKTRLLQTLGLAQLLGQAGLFVPAREANLPLVHGLFVSLIEGETADQPEGRLGREMLRIRRLFEGVGSPSMVILDELCSGTNPAEGTEIFTLVLSLLDRLGAIAFVSTHFLDYARQLEADPPVEGLAFLHAEVGADRQPTYQFLPGVAESSLARETARRLGVTFEELAELIERRRGAG